MGTSQTDVGKDLGARYPAFTSLDSQDTLESPQAPVVGPHPRPPERPPERPPHQTRNRWLVGVAIAVLVVLVFSLGTAAVVQLTKQPANTGTPAPTSPVATATTAPAPTATATTAPAPGVVLGPQVCPAGVANPTHWLPIIQPYASGGSLTVEHVSCASMTGTPSLQTLVTARHADQALDAYVFTNITQPSPTLIFHLNGLAKGDAKISGYSTVMTAEANPLSSVNAGKPISAMTADLFREFKWSAASGQMAQTVFPGIFPDLTRYQAEDDQAAVNQGHQPWKLSATQVATTMAVSLLQWPLSSATASLLSGGGAHDVSAAVQVTSGLAGTRPITVTLSRLEGNTNGGIWEAVSVASDGLSITRPAPLSQVLNPITVAGTGPAFEGQIGQVILLDDVYTKLGQANAIGAVGMGQTTFSTALPFQSTYPTGVQEGVLVLSAPSQATSAVAGAVMEKVLVDGAHEIPFAVSSVELAVSPSSVANFTCGSTVTFTYTTTFHVQAGTAGGTVQFLYTWNNGRASPSGTVAVAPNGPSTVTFTYTATGRVGPAYAFPGIAQVEVTSPNEVKSPQVLVTGTCTP